MQHDPTMVHENVIQQFNRMCAEQRETATTVDMGNNESLKIGVFTQTDGTFTAMTMSASKSFKTRKGAEQWLARRGFTPNGKRMNRWAHEVHVILADQSICLKPSERRAMKAAIPSITDEASFRAAMPQCGISGAMLDMIVRDVRSELSGMQDAHVKA